MRYLLMFIITFLLAASCDAQPYYAKMIDIDNAPQAGIQLLKQNNDCVLAFEHICDSLRQNCCGLVVLNEQGVLSEPVLLNNFNGTRNTLIQLSYKSIIYSGETIDDSINKGFVLFDLSQSLKITNKIDLICPSINYFQFNQTNTIKYNDNIVLAGTAFDTLTGIYRLNSVLFFLNEDFGIDTFMVLKSNENATWINEMFVDTDGLLTLFVKSGYDGEYTASIIKMNRDRNVTWEWTSADTFYSSNFPKGCILSDNKMIMSTTPNEMDRNARFLCIDPSGNVVWKMDTPSNPWDYPVTRTIYRVKQLANSDIIATGTFRQNYAPYPVKIDRVPFMMRFTKEGKMLWERAFYNVRSQFDYASGDLADVIEANNGDLMAVGRMDNYIPYDPIVGTGRVDQDIFVVRTDSNGCITPNCEVVTQVPLIPTSTLELDESIGIKIFPNPSYDVINIQLPTDFDNVYDLTIYDMIGNKILRTNISESNRNIDISSVPNGVYIIQIEAQNTVIFTDKFIKI